MPVGRIYSRFLHLIAHGPWGPVHQLLIKGFKKIYKIKWDKTSDFKTLGEFFLRDVPYTIGTSDIVSPVEAAVMDGPFPIKMGKQLTVKGLRYDWPDFNELDMERFKNGVFWNFYLAPHDYHWVHFPASGYMLEGYRRAGRHWPVNAIGRALAQNLYSVNERLTFRWQTQTFGQIAMICVGAMGVSGLESAQGHVSYNRWSSLKESIEKGDKALAFKLGSSALLLVERPPASTKELQLVKVGQDL